MSLRYCPRCGGPLTEANLSGHQRQCCADPECGHVFWNNPVPVLGAVVEHEGKLVLARNVAWPEGMFGLVTGFLEPGEDPAEGAVREVKEELDLDGEARELIGVYPFPQMNQVILAYHVAATGRIRLNEELAEHKSLPPEEVRYWPMSTGLAVRDWLVARGYQPERIELPASVRARLDG